MNYWKHFFSTLFRPDDFKLLLLLFSLFFIFLGIRAFWIYFQDERTTKVTATVIRAEERTGNNPHRPHTSYHFAYEYKYESKTYTSSRYHFKTEGGHSEAIKRFRAGEQIRVYIDPDHPQEAIVEKGWSWLNVIWIVVGLAICYRVLSMHAILTKEELQREMD